MAARGKYNVPATVTTSFTIASSSRGLTDPKKAHELVTKAIKKEMREADLVKKADAYYKEIVSDWSKRGTDKSWVRFKAKVEVEENNERVDVVMTMKGPQQGMDRFHMVDSRGRAPGALISVLGQMVKRTRMVTKALTEAGHEFDFKVTSKGKKRTRRGQKSSKARFERAVEQGGLGGFYFKEKKEVMGQKVMPMTLYSRKAQGPGMAHGTGKDMGSKPDGYNVEVYQGEVFPRFFTKHFLKLHITGGGNNTFRRDVKNAVNRAFTAIRTGNKMRPRKGTRLAKQRTAQKSKGPAYTGKGNYIGRARPK